MKKVILIFSVIVLASCHSVSEGPLPAADSTAIDSLVIDTAIVADSVKVDSLKK